MSIHRIHYKGCLNPKESGFLKDSAYRGNTFDMDILLTNDDGITNEGIKELAKWAVTLGNVTVVAPEAEQSGKTFFEVLKTHEKEYKDITAQLEKLGVANPAQFFEHPSNYCGLAAVKSKRLAQKYRELMK